MNKKVLFGVFGGVIVLAVITVIVYTLIGNTSTGEETGSSSGSSVVQDVMVSDEVYEGVWEIGSSGVIRDYDSYLNMIDDSNLEKSSNIDEHSFEDYDYIYYFVKSDCEYSIDILSELDINDNIVGITFERVAMKCKQLFSVEYEVYLIPVDKNVVNDDAYIALYYNDNYGFSDEDGYEFEIVKSDDVDYDRVGLFREYSELEDMLEVYKFGDISGVDEDSFEDYDFIYYIDNYSADIRVASNGVKSILVDDNEVSVSLERYYCDCMDTIWGKYVLYLIPVNKGSIDEGMDIDVEYEDY